MDQAKQKEPKIALSELTPAKHPELFEKVGLASEQIDIAYVEKIGFWTIVWSQFKKNKIAMTGLGCIVFLVLLAVYAPLLCLDKPFFVHLPGKGLCFPWARALFDRNFFENGVDIFFNLLMVLSPLYLLLFWATRKILDKRFSVYFMRVVVVFITLHLVLFGLVLFYGHYSLAQDYYASIERAIGKAPLMMCDIQPSELAALDQGQLTPTVQQILTAQGYSDISAFKLQGQTPQWLLSKDGQPCLQLRKLTRCSNEYVMLKGKLQQVQKRVYQLAAYRAGVSPWSYCYPPRSFSYRQVDKQMEHPHRPDQQFWLGTDPAGHDVIARMIYGTRISLTIGVVAVSIYITIGIILGALAGFFGGTVDLWISRFIEIMICFPTFFLILTLAAFVEEPSIFHIMVIIGITRWTTVARLIRGEFLRLRNIDYVQAAISLGFNRARIIFGHVLPNALGPVLVAATFGVASSILTESTLSFLGLGDPTAPSWGVILSQGRETGKMWLILVPGLAIFFVVSVFNLVGEGLRDALDPKLRQ